jgi:hypothetical protein
VLKRPTTYGHSQAVAAKTIREIPAAFHAVADGLPLDSHVLVQELADGPEIELLCASQRGETQVLAVVCVALTGSPGERSGATGMPNDPLATVVAGTAQRTLDALEIRSGLSTLTLRLLPNGPRVIAAHAHPPFERATLLEALTGLDLGHAAAALLHHQPISNAYVHEAHFVAERVVRSPTGGTLADPHFTPRSRQGQQACSVDWTSTIGDSVRPGARICTITSSSADRTTCQELLAQAATDLRFDITAAPP